jgi:septal ring factor EnvC (AmiA/AmiB activator)
MFFKKHKMQIQQLQEENSQLKAIVHRLDRDLRIADEKIKNYGMQLENLSKQNRDLAAEIKHLNMLAMTSNYNKNDSRLY